MMVSMGRSVNSSSNRVQVTSATHSSSRISVDVDSFSQMDGLFEKITQAVTSNNGRLKPAFFSFVETNDEIKSDDYIDVFQGLMNPAVTHFKIAHNVIISKKIVAKWATEYLCVALKAAPKPEQKNAMKSSIDSSTSMDHTCSTTTSIGCQVNLSYADKGVTGSPCRETYDQATNTNFDFPPTPPREEQNVTRQFTNVITAADFLARENIGILGSPPPLSLVHRDRDQAMLPTECTDRISKVQSWECSCAHPVVDYPSVKMTISDFIK